MIFSNGIFRYCAEAVLGIDKRRQLPGIRRDRDLEKYESSFKGKKKVLYFPGCYAFLHYPEEVWAAIYVLEQNNITVKVLPLDCCGVVAITQGDPRIAGKINKNSKLLQLYLDDGWVVIASSASCSLTLKQDYTKLASADVMKSFSGKIYDFHEYLMQLHEQGALSEEFTPMPCAVAFHVPCHLLVQKKKNLVHELVKLIPGVKICQFEDSCCGIAGTFGFKKKNYEISMHIGRTLFNSILTSKPDYIITSCGTCKIQLEDGVKGRVYHTSELLAAAYKGERLPRD